MTTSLNDVKARNKAEESKMREEYKKADRTFSENLATYDAEMKE